MGLLGVAGWFTFQALSNSLVYFLLPGEYAAQAGNMGDRRLRLGGIVEHASLVFDERAIIVHFNITDSATAFPVEHRGTPPNLFQEGVGVVVEGRFEDGVFRSDNLLVRHSEVYEVQDGPIDDEQLREALK